MHDITHAKAQTPVSETNSNTGDNRKISQNNQNSRVLMAPAEANRLIVPLGAIAESWVFSTQPPSKFTNHH